MSKIVVKNSSIHGKGLFANTHFRRGDLIGTFETVESHRDGKYRIWVEKSNSTIKPYRALNNLKYANHSYRPNTELDGLKMYAIKNVQPGEELTFHYGDDW